MNITKIILLSASMPVLITVSGMASAYDCSGSTNYTESGSYATGAIVKNGDNAYQCSVGGWCTVGGPYAPGTGWAWQHAWSDLGTCSVDGGW